MSYKITIDIISFDTKTPSKAVFSITPSGKPLKQINSDINYVQPTPNLLWSSKVTTPDQRSFYSQFTSKLTSNKDAVDSIISGESVQYGSINYNISPDPNNKTGAILTNNYSRFTLKKIDANSFLIAGLIFKCESGKNKFVITYSNVGELDALAAVMAGSVFNGSSSNAQDVMAGHLACILGQFRTLFP